MKIGSPRTIHTLQTLSCKYLVCYRIRRTDTEKKKSAVARSIIITADGITLEESQSTIDISGNNVKQNVPGDPQPRCRCQTKHFWLSGIVNTTATAAKSALWRTQHRLSHSRIFEGGFLKAFTSSSTPYGTKTIRRRSSGVYFYVYFIFPPLSTLQLTRVYILV